MRKTSKYKNTVYFSLLTASVLGLLYLGGKKAQAQQSPEQNIVQEVDAQKLLGSWYEIARLPNFFQSEDWVGARDRYEMTDTGHLRVSYLYHVKSFDAPEKEMKFKMWRRPADLPTGKFRFQALWPFTTDYWIIALDPDYRYMAVGYPNRKMLWIMSRSPSMEAQNYQKLLEDLRAQGYDVSRLIRVPQPQNGPVFEAPQQPLPVKAGS